MSTIRTVNLDDETFVPHTRHQSEVTILHHQPHFENLAEEVAFRTQEFLESEHPRYLYANPIVTISCEDPAPEFFRIARKRQSQWCQRFRKVLGRSSFRKVQNWTLVPGEKEMPRKLRKYLKFIERSLCLTGLLFIDGKPIPSDQWPDRDTNHSQR